MKITARGTADTKTVELKVNDVVVETKNGIRINIIERHDGTVFSAEPIITTKIARLLYDGHMNPRQVWLRLRRRTSREALARSPRADVQSTQER